MSFSRTIGTALTLAAFAWAIAAQPIGRRITGAGMIRSADGQTASVSLNLFTHLSGEASAPYGGIRFRQASGDRAWVEITAHPNLSGRSLGGFLTTSGRAATFDGPAVMRMQKASGRPVVLRGELHVLVNDPCCPSPGRDTLALRFCPDDDSSAFSYEGAMVYGTLDVCNQGKTIP